MDGGKVFPGEETAPVLLDITYALSQDTEQAVEIQKTFRKDTTVGEMKVKLHKFYFSALFEFSLIAGHSWEN